MTTVFYEIKARGLNKLEAKLGLPEILNPDEIKGLIVDKMNELADVAQASLQSTIPVRSYALRRAIQKTEASIKDPHAKVFIADGVHYSGAKQKAAQIATGGEAIHSRLPSKGVIGGKPPSNQKELEAFRITQRKKYDADLKTELKGRERAIAKDQSRKPRRITVNAGAQALSYIELAFLLESGGKLVTKIRRGIKSQLKLTSQERKFVEFGAPFLSTKEAIKQIEDTENQYFSKFHGKKVSFNDLVEAEASKKIATLQTKLSKLKQRSLRKLEARKSGLSTASQISVKELERFVEANSKDLEKVDKLIEKIHKFNPGDSPQKKEALAKANIQKESAIRALKESQRRLDDAKKTPTVAITNVTAELSAKTKRKIAKAEKELSEARLTAPKEAREKLLEPFKFSEKNKDKEKTTTPKEYTRRHDSEPASPFETKYAKGSPTAKWIEEAQGIFIGEANKRLTGLEKNIINAVTSDLSSAQASFLSPSKSGGVTSGNRVRR